MTDIGCCAAGPKAAIRGGGCGGRVRSRRCRRSLWSASGSVYRLRISVRLSVVGKGEADIWRLSTGLEPAIVVVLRPRFPGPESRDVRLRLPRDVALSSPQASARQAYWSGRMRQPRASRKTASPPVGYDRQEERYKAVYAGRVTSSSVQRRGPFTAETRILSRCARQQGDYWLMSGPHQEAL